MKNHVLRSGDIFESDCGSILIPVNCVGVMGAGLAKQFKERYLNERPELMDQYRYMCKSKSIGLGNPGFITVNDVYPVKNYFLVPTKNHFNDKSSLEGTISSFRETCGIAKYWSAGCLEGSDSRCQRFKSLAVPKLGCGLGGLDWSQVKPEIIKVCEEFPELKFQIYQ